MKRKARILKRVRAQIAYNDKIADQVEEALAPPPKWAKNGDAPFVSPEQWSDWLAAMYANGAGSAHIDVETSDLRGRTVRNTILDDPIRHVWDVWNINQAIAPVCPLELPATVGRSGRYGVASLLVPGVQERVTKDLGTRDVHEDMLQIVSDIMRRNLLSYV